MCCKDVKLNFLVANTACPSVSVCQSTFRSGHQNQDRKYRLNGAEKNTQVNKDAMMLKLDRERKRREEKGERAGRLYIVTD